MPSTPLDLIDSKLKNTGQSIFTIMSRMAHQHGAINLAQGFPDFDGDKVLIDLVAKHMNSGRNQYAPMAGLASLRDQISQKVNHSYRASTTLDDITITSGATQAIYNAIGVCISQGDEAILIDPSYDSYAPAVLSYGGKAIRLNLSAPDFLFPWDELEKTIGPKTKMVVLNSPLNPLGKVLYSSRFFNRLKALLKGTKIIILSDEVYEHITFDGLKHLSILSDPDLRKRSFCCFSFGKTFHFTGWKIGYVIAPPELTKEFQKIHQFTVFSVNHPVQAALAEYLEQGDNYSYIPDFYQEKRDFFAEAIQKTKLKWLGSQGSYFGLVDYGELSQEGDMAFAQRLCEKYKVAALPISPFYEKAPAQTILRFCFAKKKETLQQATDRLASI